MVALGGGLFLMSEVPLQVDPLDAFMTGVVAAGCSKGYPKVDLLLIWCRSVNFGLRVDLKSQALHSRWIRWMRS